MQPPPSSPTTPTWSCRDRQSSPALLAPEQDQTGTLLLLWQQIVCLSFGLAGSLTARAEFVDEPGRTASRGRPLQAEFCWRHAQADGLGAGVQSPVPDGHNEVRVVDSENLYVSTLPVRAGGGSCRDRDHARHASFRVSHRLQMQSASR
jgi:hypothetical protein